jgi:hypothetical protein
MYPEVCRHYWFGIFLDSMTQWKTLKNTTHLAVTDRSPASGNVSVVWLVSKAGGRKQDGGLHSRTPRRWTLVDGGGSSSPRATHADIPYRAAPPHGELLVELLHTLTVWR